MNIAQIVIFNGYLDKKKPKEIFCFGCIISSKDGSVIFSRTPFEAMEGFISVIKDTRNITYAPLGADAVAMAEALFSIGELRPVLKRNTLADFLYEKIEDYSSNIKIIDNDITNISLEFSRIDLKSRIILRFNEVGSVSIILEPCAARQ